MLKNNKRRKNQYNKRMLIKKYQRKNNRILNLQEYPLHLILIFQAMNPNKIQVMKRIKKRKEFLMTKVQILLPLHNLL